MNDESTTKFVVKAYLEVEEVFDTKEKAMNDAKMKKEYRRYSNVRVIELAVKDIKAV